MSDKPGDAMKRIPLLLALLLAPTVDAARESVSDDFPIYANNGKPDLTVDPKRFANQMDIVDRLFQPGDGTCAIDEQVVGGAGYRRLLRFDTVVLNMGDGDLVVGDRSDPNNPYASYFYYSACHGHYHIRGFSTYELLRPDGSVAAVGHKQGFCFEDSFKYSGNKSADYNCDFQGITTGWGDWYYKQLTGQWIDITGVPEGDYIVRVTINIGGIFDEGENRYPNVVQAPVHVPDPRTKVAGSP
jgi:hypothetical protein